MIKALETLDRNAEGFFMSSILFSKYRIQKIMTFFHLDSIFS